MRLRKTKVQPEKEHKNGKEFAKNCKTEMKFGKLREN